MNSTASSVVAQNSTACGSAEQVARKQERQILKADAQKVVADRDLRQLEYGAERGEQRQAHEQKGGNAMVFV